jgi:hypothetical protein
MFPFAKFGIPSPPTENKFHDFAGPEPLFAVDPRIRETLVTSADLGKPARAQKSLFPYLQYSLDALDDIWWTNPFNCGAHNYLQTFEEVIMFARWQ